MTIREKIVADLTASMKSKETTRLGVMRMLKARILEAEVDQRARKGAAYQLEDGEAVAVLAAYAKQRRDSIEAYRKAGREDLAGKEEAELAIIQEYLPAQASVEEVRAMVVRAIAELGASAPKDIGAVMKAVMPRLKGAADGKLVNEIARALLSGG